MSFFIPCRNSKDELNGEYNSFITELKEYMYDDKFPAGILGRILRAKRCEYGVEDYPEGYDFVGGGNDATPTTKCENISFEQTIESALLPT